MQRLEGSVYSSYAQARREEERTPFLSLKEGVFKLKKKHLLRAKLGTHNLKTEHLYTLSACPALYTPYTDLSYSITGIYTADPSLRAITDDTTQ